MFCVHSDPDAFHTTSNEAYNVVKPRGGATEAEYETVPAARSVPPSTSQPTTTTTSTAADYEPV